MIIVGAKGFAKELLEVCHQLGKTENLAFFDNVSSDLPDQLFGEFSILKSELEVKAHFDKFGNDFALGLGNPILRKKMTDLFLSWGGLLTSVISPHANIATFGVSILPGATILANATITASVQIGKAILMYPNSVITHDNIIGEYVELSPGATILGNCSIGDYTNVGANATILPNLQLGNHIIVGAGAVVTKNLSNNQKVKGIPAR